MVVQPKSNFLMKGYLMLDLEIYDFLKFIGEFFNGNFHSVMK